MLLINRYVPLGLTILGPVIVNILLYHLLLNHEGIGGALIVVVFWFVLFFHYRQEAACAAKSFGFRGSQAAVRRSSLYSFRQAAILPRVEQILKPTHRQTLSLQPSVKTLDAGVLHGLPWLNVHQLDLPLHAPRQKMPGSCANDQNFLSESV